MVKYFKEETKNKNVLIVGGGIIGLSTAYFLSKYGISNISVIDKDSPIKGASIRNAGTITLSSYFPWTSVNIWRILRDNLLMRKERDSYFKFSLIFDKEFRFWLK